VSQRPDKPDRGEDDEKPKHEAEDRAEHDAATSTGTVYELG